MPEMTPSSFSQISSFIYSQQHHLPQTSQQVPKLEPVKEEDSASFSWKECERAAGPAGDQAPSNQLPTHDVEAESEQLQLNQQRPFSPNTIYTEHEQTVQSQSLVTSRGKEANNVVLDQRLIDPRMFSASYDPQAFVKKSP